uniref:Putative salivary secreted peptide form 1 n=1 Tax=Aedes albopictus TaxID=7160 RepID=A0A1W7R7K8_AEDAL
MKLLVGVILTAVVVLFGCGVHAAPRPQSQTYIPGTIQWFCAQSSGSGSGSADAFGDWLRNVVQPWLPPAVCKTVVPSGSANASAT